MEDNSSSDDEIKDAPNLSLSPKLGGKKLKLNDGSSQDSLKETGMFFFLLVSKKHFNEVRTGVHFDGCFFR